jgi:hypothetical protein
MSFGARRKRATDNPTMVPAKRPTMASGTAFGETGRSGRLASSRTTKSKVLLPTLVIGAKVNKFIHQIASHVLRHMRIVVMEPNNNGVPASGPELNTVLHPRDDVFQRQFCLLAWIQFIFLNDFRSDLLLSTVCAMKLTLLIRDSLA